MYFSRFFLAFTLALLMYLFVGRVHGKISTRFKKTSGRWKLSLYEKEKYDGVFNSTRHNTWKNGHKPHNFTGDLDEIYCDPGEWINLASKESFRFAIDEGDCIISGLGSMAEKCTAEIECSNLNFEGERDKNGECDPENYIEITDSLGGKITLCGKEQFGGPYRPSNKGRDLYIRYVGYSEGTICHFICGEDRSEQKFVTLPIVKTEIRTQEKSCHCGVKNKGLSRVVNGMNASPFEFPWMAAIAFKGTRLHFCGGSLINDRYILSAAHCFAVEEETLPYEVDILLHAHILDLNLLKNYRPKAKPGKYGSIDDAPGLHLRNYTDEEEKTLRLEVEDIIVHPLWDFSNQRMDYDIALIKLKEPLNLKDTSLYNPICLPPEGKFFNYGGRVGLVAGWGKVRHNAGATARILQKVHMPLLYTKACRRLISKEMTPRMLCAGFLKGGKDTCTGDSGGPLMYELDNKRYRQIGIVSWGIGCAEPASPGVYTNVQEIIQWIYHFTQDAVWCMA